jgi:hypothetical protein
MVRDARSERGHPNLLLAHVHCADVADQLRETPERADSWIAEDVGVHPTVVKDVRKVLRDGAHDLETRSQLWPQQVYRRDGRPQAYAERTL